MLAAHSPPKSDYITVLAIYDDPPLPKPGSTRLAATDEQQQVTSKLSIPINSSWSNKMESHYSSNNHSTAPQQSCSTNIQPKSPSILRNSRKKLIEKVDGHAVHFEDRNHNSDQSTSKIENWKRGSSRKSRITDSFIVAKESIEQELNEKWTTFDRNNYQFQRIVLSADTQDLHLGLEISAVPDPTSPNKLLAVEVRSIEERGRIADDGRLRVGDQIVEINELPCQRISLARARLRLRELQSTPNPSLAFFRRIPPPKNQSNLPRVVPVATALQQSNTSQIGQTKLIHLKKEQDGFGFTYAGRESFANERKEYLYYVKGIRQRCSGSGLAVGDRILQINDVELAELTQSQVTALLKEMPVGDTIELLISRNQQINSTTDDSVACENPSPKASQSEAVDHHPSYRLWSDLKAQFAGVPDAELLSFDIPLNDTPGAGLGLSLKAQRVGATDSGLYIRSILHGSAAFKDGRLQVNDRLVGVEDQNLLNYELNGEALEAFMRTISQLSQAKKSIKLFVVRKEQATTSQPIEAPSGNFITRRGSDSDISQLSTFDREAVTRRSISEKRTLAAHRDPSHLQTYQRIVHQRQISAPALSSAITANRPARRSLYDEFRNKNDCTQSVKTSERKPRPKTVFYVDESGMDLKTDSATHSRKGNAPKARINSNSPMVAKKSENIGSERIPNSTSHASYLSEFVKSDSNGVRIDETEWKQTKNRRSSLGSGLLKLFGRGSTHKEKARADVHPQVRPDHRPPPPPYHHLAMFHPSQHHPPPLMDPGYHQQQCFFTNYGPTMANYNRTNTKPLRPNSSIRVPSSHQSPFSASTSVVMAPQQFNHSGRFGHATVPQSCDDDRTFQRHQSQRMCQHQQQNMPPSPYHPPLQIWTTMTHSMPGSLPGQAPPVCSVASDEPNHNNSYHQQYLWQQSLPLHLSSESDTRKLKPSAIFYDYGSDWIIRC